MLDQPSALIDIRGVCRSFPKGSGEQLLVLDKVDLTIRSGEIVGLLGRSGSGKSTLLRIIAGLVSPSAGQATCRGETIVGPPNGVAMSGLIETLAGPPYHGHADLPVLASQLQLEADEILHLGESLQLLRFAQLSEGDLMLTDTGKRFAHLETDARKKLFAEHLVTYVPVMGLIRRVLDERPSHTAPAARFRNELEDYMSEDYAGETLKTVVSWGRYAELFAYDEQSETFSLENPGEGG
ncbi:AAA-associated domain-containing protein [Bradyrhizobium japonicum]|uniref:AAA-associated domain-containing protein n=1 Tax=Bradyrhizobium japonicum TaxID=375 RepID=UPI003517EB33